MKTPGDCVTKLWDEACGRVKHAAVFLDNNAAECLLWNGGVMRLLQAGATEIKEFSSLIVGDSRIFFRTDLNKIVFIVSTPLVDTTAEVIRDIISASTCQHVVAITTVNFSCGLVGETGDAIERIESDLLEWIGDTNGKATAEVLHIPLSAVEICPDLFIMPSFVELHPLLDCDLTNIGSSMTAKSERTSSGRLADVTLQSLSPNIRSFYKCFVSALHDLLDEMELKEEIYSLGYTSHMIAQELENFPPARYRRKSYQNQASLVFIDRTLDLCTPTSQSCDSLLDRIIQALPRLPGHRNDVAIDMTSLSLAHNVSGETIAPGCLADISNRNLIKALIYGKQKETLMDLNRQLIEAATKEKLPVKVSGKIGRSGHEQLAKTVRLFGQRSSAVDNHLGILQASLAVSQAFDHPGNGCHRNRASTEKLLLQNTGDDTESLLTRVAKVFTAERNKAPNDRSYTLDDFLCLFVHVYSMLGQKVVHRHDDEHALQELLIEAILQESPDLPPLTKELVGEPISRHQVAGVVEEVWTRLRSVSRARQHLKQFSHLLEAASDTSPASFTPLLKRCMETILDPSKPDLTVLDYHSSALKDFLKSGFGLFKSASKPRPDNNPVCIVFVVGGVTPSEAKMINDVVTASRSPTQVVVGSTQLIGPADVTQRLLCPARLAPQITRVT